ncbi:hypothetical protein [Streptomyces sp.]|uniref:hypothetical protein n=1 Tax=Streptomyces sp. TaxID=1931 RepID=UPI002F956701
MATDMVNSIAVSQSLVPAARTATGNGTSVDRTGYEAVTVVIVSGVITDGTLYTFEVKESDDNSTFTAVADADLIGTEPALAATDDNVVREVGYKGRKRYVRVDLVGATGSPSTGGVFGAFVVLGKGRKNA